MVPDDVVNLFDVVSFFLIRRFFNVLKPICSIERRFETVITHNKCRDQSRIVKLNLRLRSKFWQICFDHLEIVRFLVQIGVMVDYDLAQVFCESGN